MDDVELRAAADEVAIALGLISKRVPVIEPPEGGDVPYMMRLVPLDLLTGAGALRLWDMLTEKYGVHSNTIRWAATEEEEAFVVVQVSLHPKCVLKTATTWPAALVLAAHAALQAGWLEGEGSDAE